MLEHFWPRQGPIFSHMPDQKQDGLSLLRITGEKCGAFPYLGNAPGGRLHIGNVHHLDTVHDQHAGLFAFRNLDNALDIGFREHANASGRQAQATGP